MKYKFLAIISLAAVLVSTANANLIRYGKVGAVDKGQLSRDTSASGSDSDVSFAGHTLGKGADNGITTGSFSKANAGASLKDSVNGITMTIDAIADDSVTITTGIGASLSIYGGNHNRIDVGESVAFTFDADISLKFVRLNKTGKRSEVGTVGKITIGGQEKTFTVGPKNIYVHLDDALLAAGDKLVFSTVSGGGWSVNALLVEAKGSVKAK